MQNKKSHVVNNVTVYVEGIGFPGVGTFKTPDLVWKKVTSLGAAGEYDRPYGAVEKLVATATMEVTSPVIYGAMAKMDEAKLVFATVINEENSDVKGERNVLIGSFDIKGEERKNGEVYKVTLELSPHYWLQEVGGIPQVEVDMQKNIVKVMGVDALEQTRKAIDSF